MNINNGKIVEEELLIRYLTGNVSEIEKEKVEEWLKARPENSDYLDQVRKVWDHSEAIEDYAAIDANQDWLKVRDRIGFDQKKNQVIEMKPVRSNYYYIVRIAAVLMIIIATGVVINMQFDFISLGRTEWMVITTGEEKKDLLLSDGTKILLNENTEISYPEKFKRRIREVKIEGEAFFNVVSDSRKPFVVDAGNDLFIEVLGTSFIVRAKNGGDEITVYVESGEVAFYKSERKEKEIVLKQNEMGTFIENEFSKKPIENQKFNSWKTNTLTYKQTPFDEVISSLDDHFDKTIQIRGSELDTLQLTWIFQDKILTEILEEFKTHLHIDYSISNDTIFLFRSMEQK